jgi:hypothetical protein
MAEAFALAASVLGVIDVATRASTSIIHVIRIMKHTPRILLELNNEITELRAVLGTVQASAHAALEEEARNTLEPLFQTARRYLEELDAMMTKLAALPTLTQRVRMASKLRPAEALKVKLGDVRRSIDEMLTAHHFAYNVYV